MFFNKEFLGLGCDVYQPISDTYGMMTCELYRCKVCGRLFYRNKIFISETCRRIFDEKFEDIKNIGYKPIGELINSKVIK